jgi:hypothetical protein
MKSQDKNTGKGKGKEGGFKLALQTNLADKFDLNDTIRITFSHPVESWDSSQIILTEDTLKPLNTVIRFTDSFKRHLFIASAWKEGKTYKLRIPQGMFTDAFGLKNDTLEFKFQTKQVNEYGTLKLNVKLEPGNSILQLLDEKDNVVRQTYLNKSETVYYEYLIPAIYRMRVIEDKNGNGKWDTGNYLKKRQPEKIIYNAQKINVRANWDIEMEWNVLPEL